MIPIPYEYSFIIYFAIWFFIIAVLWFAEEQRKKKISELSVVKERLYLCGKCHLSFMAKRDSGHITRCPRCNEMCFLKKRKRY